MSLPTPSRVVHFAADKGRDQVLCKPAPVPISEHGILVILPKLADRFRLFFEVLPSPSQWDIFMGKNPLRRIVRRAWHSADSFSDFLECGHSIHFALRPFAWQDGKLVNLEITAKRRRCQECATCVKPAISPAAKLKNLTDAAASIAKTTTVPAFISPALLDTSSFAASQIQKAHAVTSSDFLLYRDCYTALKKPAAKERAA